MLNNMDMKTYSFPDLSELSFQKKHSGHLINIYSIEKNGAPIDIETDPIFIKFDKFTSTTDLGADNVTMGPRMISDKSNILVSLSSEYPGSNQLRQHLEKADQLFGDPQIRKKLFDLRSNNYIPLLGSSFYRRMRCYPGQLSVLTKKFHKVLSFRDFIITKIVFRYAYYWSTTVGYGITPIIIRFGEKETGSILPLYLPVDTLGALKKVYQSRLQKMQEEISDEKVLRSRAITI